MLSSTRLPRPPEHRSRHTLRTLIQGHLRLLEVFLLHQDPGGRCCREPVVPDDLSLPQRGQPNSLLCWCPWEVAVDSGPWRWPREEPGTLHCALQPGSPASAAAPDGARGAAAPPPPAQSSQCLQVRVCGPLPERHTLMPIGAVSGLRSLFKHLPLPRPLGGSRTLTFSLKTGAYHSTFFWA